MTSRWATIRKKCENEKNGEEANLKNFLDGGEKEKKL
jgi:hypothetical protein